MTAGLYLEPIRMGPLQLQNSCFGARANDTWALPSDTSG